MKWTFFSMGILAGIIAVLLIAVLMNNRESQAFAATPQTADNTGQGLMLATGGATSQQNDVLWVIHKHKAPPRVGGGDSKDVVGSKDERITLCCYQVMVGGRKIKLVGVRDISFDMDLLELENDKPSVKEVVETLRKNQPREK